MFEQLSQESEENLKFELKTPSYGNLAQLSTKQSPLKKGGFKFNSSVHEFDELQHELVVEEEEKLKREEGVQFMSSLKQIYKHYENRRTFRQTHRPLREGKFVGLHCEHKYGWHTHVLAFARFTKKQIIIFCINFNSGSFIFSNFNFALPRHYHSLY